MKKFRAEKKLKIPGTHIYSSTIVFRSIKNSSFLKKLYLFVVLMLQGLEVQDIYLEWGRL